MSTAIGPGILLAVPMNTRVSSQFHCVTGAAKIESKWES